MRLRRWMAYGAFMAITLAGPNYGRAEGSNAAPDFNEVYDLIRSHLAGETDAELNKAALQGLLDQLHAKVTLVTDKPGEKKQDSGPLLAKSTVYDGSIAYLRVTRVDADLAKKLGAEYVKLSATNHLKGIILDLRYADGRDFAEAAVVAGLFVPDDQPLLDWGKGMVRSQERPDALTLPLAVLVNERTAAAPEALAAALRYSAHAIILGANTAGEATIGRDFPLKNGGMLRIATAGVKIGNGDMLSAAGVKPDISVAVRPEQEKAWYADPYKEFPSPSLLFDRSDRLAGASTNRSKQNRTTEADLIRERNLRPGVDLDYVTPDELSESRPEKPVILDPVLGRALDLIKGISAIRHARAM